MKRGWKALVFAAVVLLFFLPRPSLALASYPVSEDAQDGDERFRNLTWEQMTEDFLAQAPGSTENFGIAYYNTVTGEYHEYHGDQYFHAASLYKLPLNMHYAEKVFLREMSLDDKIYSQSYGDMQKASLQFSSNPVSETLVGYLGGGSGYVDAIRPYLVDENTDYYRRQWLNNCFTPQQMIHALRLLYEQPERYPDMIYYLGQANQDNFFCKYEQRFPIAHKYGWISEDGFAVVNDAGIVWTDEPILLVFMSYNNSGDTVTIGQFCVLMCDYCQYWYSVHQKETEELTAMETEQPPTEMQEVPEIPQEEDNAVAETAETAFPEPQTDTVPSGTEQQRENPTIFWPLMLLIPTLIAVFLACRQNIKR